MNRRSVIEFVGFQVVWFVCALGAARGLSWPGIAAALAFVAACFGSSDRRHALAAMIAASGVVGIAAESFFVAKGILRHAATWPHPGFAPAWIVALWLVFGATIGSTARLLGRWPEAKAALLGVIFGPLAYAAGSSLGALEVAAPEFRGYAVIAAVWGLAVPALVWIWRGRV